MSPAMAKAIEIWTLDRLVPYDRNPRTHSDEQVIKIAASIVEFGFVNPILVDSQDGIIAGHGRLLAARKLEMAAAPVVVLDHLTPAQRRAYVIADNRLAELGGWDEDLLRQELQELERDCFDLELVGFSDEELKDLLKQPDQLTGGLTDEDATPEAPGAPRDDHWRTVGCRSSLRSVRRRCAAGGGTEAHGGPTGRPGLQRSSLQCRL